MITQEQIAAAKLRTNYCHPANEIDHGSDDRIRLAYEWLDAQPKRSTINRRHGVWKHIIEAWAGTYISVSDVEVAAELHADVFGNYPYFNIGSRRWQ